MSIAISVIIPMYNVERYISQCLSSVVNQTFENFEIVLIDDKSVDNCLSIAKEILSKTTIQYKIIENEINSGVSVCRNIGINHANGEYIFFLDSDDIIDKNALKILYLLAIKKRYPIVFGGCKRFLDERNVESVNLTNEYTCFDIEYSSLGNRAYSALSTGGLIQKKIIIDNNCFFPLGINYGEDTIFMLKLFGYVKKIVLSNNNLYWWRFTPNSLSKTVDNKTQIERESRIIDKAIELLNISDNSKMWNALMVKYIRVKKNNLMRLCCDTNCKFDFEFKKLKIKKIIFMNSSVFFKVKEIVLFFMSEELVCNVFKMLFYIKEHIGKLKKR